MLIVILSSSMGMQLSTYSALISCQSGISVNISFGVIRVEGMGALQTTKLIMRTLSYTNKEGQSLVFLNSGISRVSICITIG